ncbi:MAG: cytidylate kinase [Methylophilaceae bacterium 17-44-8]|jgi:cytidylate kinase|nr:MAG: cytidylate kinase [Methylophilales bacterium 28-44-11]OYY98833.1 MAG: cytidylate kinase [Methylophilales bacterium 16-45-7]OZA06410.1 MAG: cytidylate kinase [Methylophilaceae bacterium 17-44-8]
MSKLSTSIPVIAIDGPSASGKGSVAELVAEALGFHYLDSGAIYRIVAYASQQQNIAWDHAAAIASLTSHLSIQFAQGEILLNGTNITSAVRSEEMGRGASEVAVHPAVRYALLDLQKQFRQSPGLVADGRDMASVVFPDAALKIFLTANVEVRAQRRFLQLRNRGLDAHLETILNDLQQRDFRDSQRSAAPLKQMLDALLLDTTERTIQEAVDFILNAYKKI